MVLVFDRAGDRVTKVKRGSSILDPLACNSGDLRSTEGGGGVVVEAGCALFSLLHIRVGPYILWGEGLAVTRVPTDSQKLLPVATLGTQDTRPALGLRLSGQSSSLKP